MIVSSIFFNHIATANKDNEANNWFVEPNIGHICKSQLLANHRLIRLYRWKDTWAKALFFFVVSSKNSLNINLANLVAVSRLVKANADIARAAKFSYFKGSSNLCHKGSTPLEKTFPGPPLSLSHSPPVI